jgi:hypothetical protein
MKTEIFEIFFSILKSWKFWIFWKFWTFWNFWIWGKFFKSYENFEKKMKFFQFRNCLIILIFWTLLFFYFRILKFFINFEERNLMRFLNTYTITNRRVSLSKICHEWPNNTVTHEYAQALVSYNIIWSWVTYFW